MLCVPHIIIMTAQFPKAGGWFQCTYSLNPCSPSLTPVKQKCNNINTISKNGHQSFSVIAITYFPSLFGRTFVSILFEPRCRWSLVRRTKSEAEHSVVGASVAGTLFLPCHPQGLGQTRVSKFKIGFLVWLSQLPTETNAKTKSPPT